MRNQSGISSLLAAAASLLVVGMVAVGSPASAASEEDLAAPHGSFISTLAVPNATNSVTLVRDVRPAPVLTASEEDAAVPQGSFTSTMAAPSIHGKTVKLAGDYNQVSLPEIVAGSLE